MIGNGVLYKKRLFKGWLVYSFKLWINHFFIYYSNVTFSPIIRDKGTYCDVAAEWVR